MTDYATLAWKEEAGEGYVRLSKQFKETHWVLQLDALQDWIYELQNIYNSYLEKLEDGDGPKSYQ